MQARSGRHLDAIETYRRAAELNPKSIAAELGLGNTLKTVGRQAEAIEAYRRATVLRPDKSEAWWSLSNLKTFRFEDVEIAEMERQLARTDLGGEQRVQFCVRAGQGARGSRRVRARIRAVRRAATARGARSSTTTRCRPR